MDQALILDTTLRDGEQSPGLYFTHGEKLRLAQALDALGIGLLEAGIPAMGEEEQACLSDLCRLGLKAEILAWNRMSLSDVDASLRCGVTNVHLSLPTSDFLLQRKLGKNRDWALGQIEGVIRYAGDHGLRVSFGAEDASRSDPDFLLRAMLLAQDLGAVRVRFADTLGILSPERAAMSISGLAAALRVPIDFHGHNDFGLATANALSAWRAGAKVVSCSVLGWGERAGNTALEEFLACMRFLEGHYLDFDFVALRALCDSLASSHGRPIAVNKPIVGRDIFTHESGIHVDGMLKDEACYEAFSPASVGAKRRFVAGKHSGRTAIRAMAGMRGMEIDDEDAAWILRRLRSTLDGQDGLDTEGLFEALLAERLRPGQERPQD